jgi:Putative prokaryotic signal transducing protein
MALQVLSTHLNYVQANLHVGLLAQHGIMALIADDQIAATYAFANATGGIRVMVKNTDFANAQNVLNTSETNYLNTLICSFCGNAGFKKTTTMQVAKNTIQRFINKIKYGTYNPTTTLYQCCSCLKITPQ